jgi:hypothetical protein
MTRPWFRALARKFFSGRQLRTTSRPKRRRGVRLRLEQLEDRTVTSTLQVNSPLHLTVVPEAAVTATTYQRLATSSINAGFDATGFSRNGWDNLLQDVQGQALVTPAADVSGRLASVQDWTTDFAVASVTLDGIEGDGKQISSASPLEAGAAPQPTAAPTNLSSPGALSQPFAPPGSAASVREIRAENVLVQPSPSGGMTRTDQNIPRGNGPAIHLPGQSGRLAGFRCSPVSRREHSRRGITPGFSGLAQF